MGEKKMEYNYRAIVERVYNSQSRYRTLNEWENDFISNIYDGRFSDFTSNQKIKILEINRKMLERI